MNTSHYAVAGAGMTVQELIRNLALVTQTQIWNTGVAALTDPNQHMRE